MQQPGWYPDPSGQPGSFRFWDGRQWATVTTTNPTTTPHPRPVPSTQFQATRSKKAPVVVLAVAVCLIVGLVAVGAVRLLQDRADSTPVPSPSPSGPVLPSRTPGPSTALSCIDGNDNVTRTHHDTFHSTGVTYDSVPDWKFSFHPDYWTWMDDHSSLGAVRLDGGTNQAGVTLGGVRFDQGFGDQTTAGELTVACLEGTLSVEEPTYAGPPTTRATTLGGMVTYHTHVEFTSDRGGEPLLVDIYVIDADQPTKWAQLITFQQPNSEAQPLIAQAVSSVRRG